MGEYGLKAKSPGFHSQLLHELRLEKNEIYENYFRMAPENFEEL